MLILITSLHSVLLHRPPHYLDPGSGSLIIQITIAALLGLGVLIRSQWGRIKKLFNRNTAEDITEEDEKDD